MSAITQSSLLRLICRALDDKKAVDLRVLRVSEQSSITDFLVLATGTSDPHLRALRVELEKVIDATGTRILGMDTEHGSGWLVVDAFDVMIHLFTPENREKYALENLWRDAEELTLEEVFAEVTARKAKAPAKKAAAKKEGVKKTASKKAPAKKTVVKKKAVKKKA